MKEKYLNYNPKREDVMNKFSKIAVLTCIIASFSLFSTQKARVNPRSSSTDENALSFVEIGNELEDFNSYTETQLEKENEQIKKVLGCPSSQKLSASLDQKVKTKAFFSFDPVVFLPEDGHFLISASTQRKAITFEDGSVWKVSNSDLYKLLNWKSNDFLFVTQNRSWFSSYPYRIINHTTKEAVEAYLYEGPVINGEHSNYIFAMDFDVGEIVFADNKVWDLCEADYSTYRNWALDDLIIVGINTGWRSEYTHILINATLDSWVRARVY